MFGMVNLSERWRPVPSSLRSAWFLVGATGFALNILCRSLTPAGWISSAGWLLASSVWFYIWLYAGWHLVGHKTNEAKEIELRLGAGNLLTLGRGWLLALLAGFLLGPEPDGFGRWLPVVAYTVSDIADYFDGYLARRQGLATNLGVALDLELDALGLLLAVGVAIHLGALPWWFITFGVARYSYTVLIRVRQWLGLPVYELSPSKGRRPIAGISMGYISASLWPILDQPELTLAGVVFMLPFTAGFIRDGLVVAGQLDPSSPDYRRWRSWGRRLLLQWAPLIFRAGVLYLVFLEVPSLLKPSEQLMRAVSNLWVLRGFALIILLGGGAIVLGWAGRFAAFAVVFPFGLTIAATSLTVARAPALVSLLAILILGTGRFSLWQPSDRVFAQRAGERVV